MTDEQQPHIEGVFHLHEHGGHPVASGSQLHHGVNGKKLHIARHVYPDTARLIPGASTRARLTFQQSGTVAQSFWAGREIQVYRGKQPIGRLRVTQVLAPALAGNARTLAQATAAFDGPPPLRGIYLGGIVYLLLGILALHYGIVAHKPCVSNFEGGCGMGRAIAAMFSLLPAGGAFVAGIILMSRLAAHPTVVDKLPRVSIPASLLWMAPLAYLLYMVYVLFLA